MKTVFVVTGKTSEKYLMQGMSQFQKRLNHYTRFDYLELPDIKGGGKFTPEKLKDAEGEQLLQLVQPGDFLVLLDERGATYTSRTFAAQMQKWMNAGPKRIVFAVGGAYGFSPAVYAAAQQQLSLSSMTTSHQLIRLVFLEQLYRAHTILNNEPYHND